MIFSARISFQWRAFALENCFSGYCCHSASIHRKNMAITYLDSTFFHELWTVFLFLLGQILLLQLPDEEHHANAGKHMSLLQATQFAVVSFLAPAKKLSAVQIWAMHIWIHHSFLRNVQCFFCCWPELPHGKSVATSTMTSSRNRLSAGKNYC